MANRSSGARARTVRHDYGIWIQTQDGCEQIAVNETSRRRALGRAFAGREGRVLFCKTAEEMTREERCEWDMQTEADLRAELREQQERRMNGFTQLDMF